MMAELPSGILWKMKFVNVRNMTGVNVMAYDCLHWCVLEMFAGLCVRACARVWPIHSSHHLLCLVHTGGLLGFRAPGFQLGWASGSAPGLCPWRLGRPALGEQEYQQASGDVLEVELETLPV